MAEVSENNPERAPWVPVQPGLFQYPPTPGEVPALLANCCMECGKVFFPKRRLCPACFSMEMENIRLRGGGVIYSATVVRISSPTGVKAPYAYGYVDMSDKAVRLFALFTGDQPETFLPGREVELVLGPVSVSSGGQEVIGYKFRPVFENRETGAELGDEA